MHPLAVIVAGLLALFAVVGFFRTLQTPRNAQWLIVGMILAAGMAIQVDRVGNQINMTYLNALQQQRASIYLAFGSILFLGMLIHFGRLRLNTMPVQGLLLLAIQIVASILRFYHEGPVDGATSLVFALVTMTPIMLLLPHALERWDDWTRLVRVFGFAAAIWAFLVAIQVVIDHRQLVLGAQSRFTGLLGNPQGTGLYMAPMTVALIWLILNDTERRLRWIWIGALCLMSVYTLWTGSRTCILVTGIGTIFVLYSRAGKAVLLLPVFLALVYGALQVALMLGFSSDALERLGSKQDTRSLVWTILLEDAMANPLLGTGFKQTRANENSYLVAFGAYGIAGGGLVLVLTIVSFFLMLKVMRLRSYLPPGRKQIADLILGFNAMFFAGAFFEWYIISRLEGMLPYMLIYSVMTRRMIDKLTTEAPEEDPQPMIEDAPDYSAWDHYGREDRAEPQTGSNPSTA